MITLVKDYLREIVHDEDELTQVRASLPASPYNSGHFSPTQADVAKNVDVFLQKALLRV